MADFVVWALEAEGKEVDIDFTLQDVKDYAYALVLGMDKLAGGSRVGHWWLPPRLRPFCGC